MPKCWVVEARVGNDGADLSTSESSMDFPMPTGHISISCKTSAFRFPDSTCCGSSSSELSLSSSDIMSATGQSQLGTERDVPHRETFERVQFTSLSSSRASPYTIACATARSIQVFNTHNYAAFAFLS